jgi:hypothetical protein
VDRPPVGRLVVHLRDGEVRRSVEEHPADEGDCGGDAEEAEDALRLRAGRDDAGLEAVRRRVNAVGPRVVELNRDGTGGAERLDGLLREEVEVEECEGAGWNINRGHAVVLYLRLRAAHGAYL